MVVLDEENNKTEMTRNTCIYKLASNAQGARIMVLF
jgi:hypothetical protein